MFASENPYASPSDLTRASPRNRQLVLKQLRAPAAGLLICSVGMLTVYGLNAFVLLAHYALGNMDLIEATLNLLYPLWFAHLAIFLGNLFALYAAIQMLRGRQYSVCITGAVIAMVPVVTPCYVVGIPFAIWIFMLLRHKDTRAAFVEAK